MRNKRLKFKRVQRQSLFFGKSCIFWVLGILHFRFSKTMVRLFNRKIRSHNLRAPPVNPNNSIDIEVWAQLLHSYKYKCAYCDCDFTRDNKPTLEHIVPVKFGGETSIYNCIPSCDECNNSKSSSNNWEPPNKDIL